MNKNSYQQRRDVENLARQDPRLQVVAKDILKTLETIERSVYWAVDPEENDPQWASSMIEHAHALLDLSHDYRAALIAHPPLKEEEEGQESA